jgi:hypothetical protein
VPLATSYFGVVPRTRLTTFCSTAVPGLQGSPPRIADIDRDA